MLHFIWLLTPLQTSNSRLQTIFPWHSYLFLSSEAKPPEMRQILLFSILAIATLSCTKSALHTEQKETVSKEINTARDAVPEMSVFFGDETKIKVNVKAEPFVICDSYQDNATPKPCNIYIDFTCTLSQAVNNYVRIEIERSNLVQVDKTDRGEGDTTVSTPPVFDAGARITLIIPPNAKSMVFRSTLSNPNNSNVPEKEFRIVSAGFYTPMD
jgi:hypothetical protein